MKEIRDKYPDFTIKKISVMTEPYNNRVTISKDSDSQYIFLDGNNQIVATQDAKYTRCKFYETLS